MPVESQALTGGCQCGAVRYRLHMPPQGVHYCHCRMCQRAVGNIFATLAPVHKDKLEWTQGQAGFFRSSTAAQRGFCAACGTPLTFAYDDSKWICVTVGSLDNPSAVKPEIHYGVESQVHWFSINDELPREETQVNDYMKDMAVFQFHGLTHG